MKKAIRIVYSVFILCGLIVLAMVTNVGISHASSLMLQPVQVQSSGYTNAKGAISVSATCPQDYHVQSGSVQVTVYSQGQTPLYSVQANGPDPQGRAWTTTIKNDVAGSVNVTVTAICAKK
jgi:hypothetical protein